MSTVPTVEIDGNDVTSEMQDKSLTIKRQGVDLTLIDPAVWPVGGDTLTVDTPAWSGTVVSIESNTFEGDVPFVKVRATNADTLPDNGAGAFNLSDTPNLSTTFGYKDLTIMRRYENPGGVNELRAKCTVFEEGLMWGDELELTSAGEGFSAEVFTIMDMTVEYPVEDAATYSLDLGIGDYADAMTGASSGNGFADSPLWPITLGGPNGELNKGTKRYLADSGGTPTLAVVLHQNAAYSAASGSHTVDWDQFYEGSTGDVLGAVPASIGWSYDGSGTLTTLVAGTWLLDFSFSVSKTNLGYLAITNSFSWGLADGFSIPNALGDQSAGGVSTFRVILPATLPLGTTLSVDWVNTAAAAALSSAYLEITRIGFPYLI